MAAFIAGLRFFSFMFSVIKKPQSRMAKLLLRAQKYMNAEDVTKARRGKSSHEGEKRNDTCEDRREIENKRNRTERVSVNDHLGLSLPRERQAFTLLNTLLEHILVQIQNYPMTR